MPLVNPCVSCHVVCSALTGELLWHWALPFGYIVGEPVEQQSTLSAHLTSGCLSVLCLTAREWESKCNEEMKTSSWSSSIMSDESAPSCNCPPVKAFEVIKWSKKKKKKSCKTHQLLAAESHWEERDINLRSEAPLTSLPGAFLLHQCRRGDYTMRMYFLTTTALSGINLWHLVTTEAEHCLRVATVQLSCQYVKAFSGGGYGHRRCVFVCWVAGAETFALHIWLPLCRYRREKRSS